MIAIHECRGSFSDRWIEYCMANSIPFVLLDIHSNDIFDKLRHHNIGLYLTHPQMADRASRLAARSVIQCCNMAGIRTFPSLSDYWHFDDKVAQKYVFEALGIRTPKTYVFYDKKTALNWAEKTTYPVVFKLKAGAGSINVSLVHEKREAFKKIKIMFGRGYSSTDGAIKDISTKLRNHQAKRDWAATFLRLPRTLKTLYSLRQNIERERGYVYFQEFITRNDYDTRVAIIGSRAFAFRRRVRPNDFRASGSGCIDYSREGVDLSCVESAFQYSRLLKSECIAFDFIFRPESNESLLVEMSFGFIPDAIYYCPGHWDSCMNWHPGMMWPQDAILSDLMSHNIT